MSTEPAAEVTPGQYRQPVIRRRLDAAVRWGGAGLAIAFLIAAVIAGAGGWLSVMWAVRWWAIAVFAITLAALLLFLVLEALAPLAPPPRE
jgi:hypothetical protein